MLEFSSSADAREWMEENRVSYFTFLELFWKVMSKMIT